MKPTTVTFPVGDVGPNTPIVPVDITPERVVCPRHGEVFRLAWPDGFMPFSIHLFERFVNDPIFAEEIGLDGPTLEAMLDTHPICERVTKETLIGAYMLSGLSTEALCANCGNEASGVPYSCRMPSGPVRLEHLCFRCLVYRTELMN